MRAYLAHRDRLLVVDDVEGADPAASTAERLQGRQPECVAAHPDRPDRAFVGTAAGELYRTTDGGESFEPIGEGIDQDRVTAVATAADDPEELWVGTEPSRCYRSRDAGATFEHLDGLTEVPSADEWAFPPRPQTHHVRWIEPDPTDADRWYVGIEAGALVWTDDGGDSWHDRPSGSRRDTHQLATHAEEPGRVYVAAGDGYAESTDGGRSWTPFQTGLEHTYVWSVCPDPADPDRVLATAARGPGSAHSMPGESYCYRREHGHWQRLDGPLSGEGVLRGVLASGADGGHAYGATNRGLYRTTDFGEAWTRLDIEWPDALRDQTVRGLAVVEE